VTIRRALLSVYDKTGLAPFAQALADDGVELVASGGTAAALVEAGLVVTPLEELTGFGELLGHRVVTLHPAVHGGILARRDVPEDLAQLETHGIAPIDLVCVNLYPFERTIGRLDVDWEDAIEQIDIGGPTLLRAAAKNHAHVVTVCRPDDYEPVLEELRSGEVSQETRRSLAARAFQTTASLDAAIATWLGREEPFPETYLPVFDRVLELSYGENPHQQAVYYMQRGARTHILARVELLQGKPLSFNNLGDLSAGRLLLLELEGPAAVIVKHGNPCGVAKAATIEEAYEKARAADPVSAYGGVVVLDRPVSNGLGGVLSEHFIEVLHAPGYDDDALAAFAGRETMRVLANNERRAFVSTERDLRRALGGLLVQDRDTEGDPLDAMDVVCGDPDAKLWEELLFAWTVAKHVTSNAIVLSGDGQTIGIGAGQMSRIDAVRLAIDRAREHGHALEGAVLASDAFFPFVDGVHLALEAGIRAIIQPGGSKRDAEVTDAVLAAGATMVHTGRRHFKH